MYSCWLQGRKLMDTFMVFALVLGVSGFGTGQEEFHSGPDFWRSIQSLAQSDTPEQNRELLNYVKSLTPKELMVAARQGCIAGENKPKLTLDWERKAAAESNALLCLEAYFGILCQDEERKQDCEEMATQVMKLLPDRDELICLRRAIVKRISYSENTRFQLAMMHYAARHPREVDGILGPIIKNRHEESDLRREAMSALSRGIHKQARAICRSDPNVRGAIEEKRKHTNKLVRVSELIRAGEVTLTEETLKALEPIAARIFANVKLLGALIADEANEPADLRKQAKRTLEGYLRSPLTQVDDDIEKALGQGNP